MDRRSEYLKTYKIGLKLDTDDMKDITRQIQELRLDKTISSEEVRKNLVKGFEDYKKHLKEIEILERQIAEVSKLSATPENVKLYKELVKTLSDTKSKLSYTSVGDKDNEERQKQEARKQVISEIASYAKNIWTGIVTSVANFALNSFKSIISTLGNMATYNLGGSYFINSSAREQAMQYGLSNAQNYAFTRAKEFMGINSEEDLFYMNEQQREKFAERMGYYTSKYEELNNEEFFQTWQETQIELKELKEEFTLSIGKFIVDNKDLIISVLRYALTFMEYVGKALTLITHGFEYQGRSASEKAARMSELLGNNSSVINNTHNASVQMSPVYNVYGGDLTKIQEQQRLEYEQIYAAYNNG